MWREDFDDDRLYDDDSNDAAARLAERLRLLLKRKAWGSRSGAVLIEEMTNYHLSQAIAWLEKNAEYPHRIAFLKLMFKEQLKRWREEGS